RVASRTERSFSTRSTRGTLAFEEGDGCGKLHFEEALSSAAPLPDPKPDTVPRCSDACVSTRVSSPDVPVAAKIGSPRMKRHYPRGSVKASLWIPLLPSSSLIITHLAKPRAPRARIPSHRRALRGPRPAVVVTRPWRAVRGLPRQR